MGLGWASHLTDARPTGRGGLGGGTAAFFEKGLHVTHGLAAPGTQDVHAGTDRADLWDVTPVVVHLDSLDFLLVSVYLTCGEGMDSWANKQKLATLASLARDTCLPWMFVGDWNVPPAIMESSHWLTYVGGVVLRPDGVDFTCAVGDEGTFLDYAVVSWDMKPWISAMWGDPVVPWKPHIAVRFQIARPAEDPLIRVQRRPYGPSLGPIKSKDLHLGGQQPEGKSWSQCRQPNGGETQRPMHQEEKDKKSNDGSRPLKNPRVRPTQNPERGPMKNPVDRSMGIQRSMHQAKRSLPYLADPAASDRLGRVYAEFLQAAEAFHAARDPREDPVGKAVSRARRGPFQDGQALATGQV